MKNTPDEGLKTTIYLRIFVLDTFCSDLDATVKIIDTTPVEGLKSQIYFLGFFS